MTNVSLAIIVGFLISELNLVLFFVSLHFANKTSHKAMNYILTGFAIKFLMTLSLLMFVLFLGHLPSIPLVISFFVTTIINLILEITILVKKKT